MATNRYIALLRGINVGGNNLIKMDALRTCLEAAGLKNVSTYIASGNVLFESKGALAAVESSFDGAVDEAFGYKGPTVILSEEDFRAVVNEAPKGFGAQPDTLHSDVVFLKYLAIASEVMNDIITLKLRDGVDTVAAGSKALYFTRVSELRIKSRMNKITALASYKNLTIRSWKTVKKLDALLDAK